MKVCQLKDLKIPIGELFQNADPSGILLDAGDNEKYALLPLNDDLVDFLIERNSAFIEECRQICRRMEAGQFRSHQDVKKQFP